jgi:hypothetical protein
VNSIGQDKMVELAVVCLNKLIESMPDNYKHLSYAAKFHVARLLSRERSIQGIRNQQLTQLFKKFESKFPTKDFLVENLRSSLPLYTYDDQSLLYHTLKKTLTL